MSDTRRIAEIAIVDIIGEVVPDSPYLALKFKVQRKIDTMIRETISEMKEYVAIEKKALKDAIAAS